MVTRDTEVKVVTSDYFKVTITAIGELRIKIPQGTDTNIERTWINRCKLIREYFLMNPYNATLRAKTKITTGCIHLRISNKSKTAIFKVEDTTPELLETS